MAAIAVRESTTRSGRILASINDQPRDDETGRRSGWAAGDEASQPAKERSGPALMPFLRYRGTDRAWRVGFGLGWIPAIIVVITVEGWMGISQSVQWISLGVVFVLFIAAGLYFNRAAR